jgi:5-oxoprolinase (ATP-hydrolysing)
MPPGLDARRRGGRGSSDKRQLVAEGRFLEDEIRTLLTTARYPARSPETISPTCARRSPRARRAPELDRMVGHFGLDVVNAYMQHVQDNAEESVRRVIHKLKDGAVHRRTWTTAA